MRNYVMSFGMQEKLHYFTAGDDSHALIRALSEGAEYCVRLRGWKGPTKYTVMPYAAEVVA